MQTIYRNGEPAFVVIPYDEFQRRFAGPPWIPDGALVPHEVLEVHVHQDVSLPRAWREYLGLTQDQVARAMGITQSALSQIERKGARPRRKTLERLRLALGLQSVEQLR